VDEETGTASLIGDHDMAKHRRPPPGLFPEPAAAMPAVPIVRPADRPTPVSPAAPRPAAQKDGGGAGGTKHETVVQPPPAVASLGGRTFYLTAGNHIVEGPAVPADAVMYTREGQPGWHFVDARARAAGKAMVKKAGDRGAPTLDMGKDSGD
jgi:hypothetical protein